MSLIVETQLLTIIHISSLAPPRVSHAMHMQCIARLRGELLKLAGLSLPSWR